jgi:membrane protease YdiL (CAAX protease family)
MSMERQTDAGTVVRGRDLLIVLVLTVAILFALRMLLGGVPRTPPAVFALLTLQSAVPMTILYLLVIRRRGLTWRAIGLRPAQPRWYAAAVALAFLSLPVVMAVNAGVQALLGEPLRNPQLEMLAPAAFSWSALALMLAMAGVVVPIVEEIVFRGLVFGWLWRRFGFGLGMLASALVFAFAHGIPALAPALAVQGVALAWLYARSDSLWPAVVMHGTFNALMSILLYAAIAAGVPLR